MTLSPPPYVPSPPAPPQFVPPSPPAPPQFVPAAPPQFVPPAQYAAPGTPAWGTPPSRAGWQHGAPAAARYQPPAPLERPGNAGKVIGMLVAVLLLAAMVGVAVVIFTGTSDDRAKGSANVPAETVAADPALPAGSGAAGADPAVAAPGETLPASPILELFSGPWSTVRTSDGTFSLQLPGDPQRQPIQVPVNNDTVGGELLFSGNDDLNVADVGLLATTADYSGMLSSRTIASSFDTFLRGAANGAIRPRNGTLTSTSRASSPIGPAGEFTATFSRSGLVMHGFMVVHGTRMLALMVIVDEQDDAIGKLALAKAVASLRAT